MAILKKFGTKNLFATGAWIHRPNSIENRGEIKEIRSLEVNYGKIKNI